MKYLALLLVGALAFTACSKDDSEVKEGDNIVNVDNSRPDDKNNLKPVVPKKNLIFFISKFVT